LANVLSDKHTHKCDIYYAAYTEIGGDEELPLGEEFQEHLKRFIKPSEKKIPKKFELVRKLVDQLAYVAVKTF